MLRSNLVTRCWAPVCLIVGLIAGRAEAGALNPNSFPTLGNFPTTSGTYTINTTTLEFRDPVNTLLFTGDTTGSIAVFTFNGGTTSGINITATGSRPLALLFQGDFTYNGTLNGGGGNGGSGSAGSGGPGGGAGGGIAANGSGLGGGGGSSSGHGGGGGFGGHGGNALFGGLGGGTYGDLTVLLQGGSGGGGGHTSANPGGGGGGGGGAVEIGVTGALTLGGSLRANGGAGAVVAGYDGGGGSGGGIFLHAARVTLSGSLSAQGGDTNRGGSGGGGRVLIQASVFAKSGTISAAGGDITLQGPNGDQYGQPGVITVPPITTPTSLTQTLQTSVTTLVNNGAMLPADGNSLQAKLNAALAALAAGDTATAKTKLQDFINQVNALVKSQRLTAAQAQPLINAANAILALLG